MIQYRIPPRLFELYPGYVRGLVICQDLINSASPPDLTAMLRQAEEALRAALTVEDLPAHPVIAAWREAYRRFGAKPSEFRSSLEAMARRVLRGQELPSINTLVDIGNYLSISHMLPVGGHAIDHLTADLELRPADGSETFIPFGGTDVEHPEPGEIIFVEGQQVLTRRWTWRQANHTLTLPETTAIAFNLDGLPPVGLEQVRQAADETAELVKRFCGGSCRFEVLSEENPQVTLIP